MNIKALIEKMTLEEKAGFCSGADFWHTKAVERLGIPAMMMSDGPHGLRKQDVNNEEAGVNDAIPAVCFPAGCATASSFDRNLVYRMGEALGNQCQAEQVGVILGPGVNIKRSPLCGRNFEYYSEDPLVASQTATGFIQGVQSKGVGVSLKHFYANNQETRRMSSSAQIDERTKREIYLRAFETPVKEAKPWTVMCSYNRINGTYAAENQESLTKILRDEWGFDGYVVSDWGAVNDRVADLQAGLDLEMPASYGINDAEIVRAVKEHRLEERVLDQAVERVLNIVYRSVENQDKTAVWDKEKDHELAREIATQCMVLLKNEEGILPLEKKSKVAYIGAFAEKPRYQGGGSSHINSTRVDNALACAKACGYDVSYAKGYEVSDDVIRQELIDEAVELAKQVEVAVIFAGLPDLFESEGYDRSHMSLPNCQNALIEAVAQANPNTVVVLHNGSPVEMPWIAQVKGILEAYLCGQAVGSATVDLLYGDVNPSGHLAETFPLKMEDNPSYLYYLGEGDVCEYREGVFVGYRYYSTKKMPVLFPFGHGLSYTTFEMKNLQVRQEEKQVLVSVDVTNTGKRFGKEVVQLYVQPPKTEIIRPVRELRDYMKVELEPGETKTVRLVLQERDFAYYNPSVKDWVIENGTYQIMVGNSSEHLPLTESIELSGYPELYGELTMNTTVGDLLRIPGAKEIMEPLITEYAKILMQGNMETLGESTMQMMESQLHYMPIRGMVSFGNGVITLESCHAVLDQLRAKIQ